LLIQFYKVDGDIEDYAARVNEKELLVDSLEHELTTFLVLVIRNTTSNEISEEIEETLNAVNNLERIGDHGEILFKQIQRLHKQKLVFLIKLWVR